MEPDATWRDLPGHTIRNPVADEPFYLDVVAVSGPNPDGGVTIVALEDTVESHPDMNWFDMWRSPEIATLEDSLLIEERHRLGETETTE